MKQSFLPSALKTVEICLPRRKIVQHVLVTKSNVINTTEGLKIKGCSSIEQADTHTEKEGVATLLWCRMEFWENKKAMNLRLIKTDTTRWESAPRGQVRYKPESRSRAAWGHRWGNQSYQLGDSGTWTVSPYNRRQQGRNCEWSRAGL